MVQSAEISLLHYKRLYLGMTFLVGFTYLTFKQSVMKQHNAVQVIMYFHSHLPSLQDHLPILLLHFHLQYTSHQNCVYLKFQ